MYMCSMHLSRMITHVHVTYSKACVLVSSQPVASNVAHRLTDWKSQISVDKCDKPRKLKCTEPHYNHTSSAVDIVPLSVLTCIHSNRISCCNNCCSTIHGIQTDTQRGGERQWTDSWKQILMCYD